MLDLAGAALRREPRGVPLTNSLAGLLVGREESCAKCHGGVQQKDLLVPGEVVQWKPGCWGAAVVCQSDVKALGRNGV